MTFNVKYLHLLLLMAVLLFNSNISAQEVIFADYFDIKANEPEGTEVIGKVNLKSNKDIVMRPISTGYHFLLNGTQSQRFIIETQFDDMHRIFGVLKVALGYKSGKVGQEYKMHVQLKDRNSLIASKEIIVRVVDKTMWQILYEHYAPITLVNPRLYGGIKIKDVKLPNILNELENNNGKFKNSPIYEKQPLNFSKLVH